MKLNYLGVPVWINGRNYYMPSLSYQDFKANCEFLSAVPELKTGAQMVEYFDKVIPIVGLAMRRNYPDFADAELAAQLDLTTLNIAVAAVQNASGMKPVSEGEEQPVA